MNQQMPYQNAPVTVAQPQPAQPQPGAQPAGFPQPGAPGPQGPARSGLAVAALVLGIVAAALSWVPIVNNLAFLVALVGIVLGIVALVGAKRKGKGGRGLAVAGIVLGAVSLVVVLATQAAYTSAIDEAFSGATVQGTSSAPASSAASGASSASSSGSSSASSASSSSSAAAASADLAVGTSATLSDGLVVTVDAVQRGLAKYDGSPAVGITVTYVNNSSKEATFNPYDWKAQDAQGAQRSQTYLGTGTDELHSGSLAPGGTVTGNLYFEGDVVKALYYANMFNSAPTASWVF